MAGSLINNSFNHISISGKLGQALLFDANNVYILEESNNDSLKKVNHYEKALFYAFANDYVEISNRISLSEAKKQLSVVTEQTEALELALIAMNKQDDLEIRCNALKALQQYFKNGENIAFVRNRLFSEIPAENFDLDSTITLAIQLQLRRIIVLFQELKESLNSITILKNAVDIVLPKYTHETDIPLFHRKLRDKGFYCKLIPSLNLGSEKQFNSEMLPLAKNFEKFGFNVKPIMFLNELKLFLENENILRKNTNAIIGTKDANKKVETLESIFINISNEIKEHQQNKIKRKKKTLSRHRNKEKNITYYNIDQKINNPILYIENKIKQSDEIEAVTALYELIKRQIHDSKKEHLCKTLCNVSNVFLKFGNIELAERVLKIVDDLFYKDSAYYCLKAEMLKHLGQLEQALKLYNEVISQFPNDVVMLCGKAEVLKHLGELEQSLKLYNETITQFPNSEVARNGKAEVLKQLGELEQALKLYNETITQFPNSEVARCGKAEILKQQGELKQALKLYNETIIQFPNDEVMLCGKAEILKQQGQLEQALALYNETINLFPNNEVARNGVLSIKLLQGTINEDELLPLNAKCITLSNWIHYHISAMYFLKKEKYEEAISRFEYGLKNSPFKSDLKYFKSALNVAKLLNNRALLENVKQILNDLLQEANNNPIVHLVEADCYGILGNKKQAELVLNKIKNEKPTIKKGKQLINNRYHIYNHYKAINTLDFEQQIKEIYIEELV